MADIKNKYGSAGQAFTLTAASLTNGSARQSAEIDNTTDLFLDALVFAKLMSGASGTAATGRIELYAFGSADGGTTRTDNAGASDAAITVVNARLIGVMDMIANGTTYYGGPFSVAAAFGGILPDHWGLIIKNQSGGTLNATAGNHSLLWQGVMAQAV